MPRSFSETLYKRALKNLITKPDSNIVFLEPHLGLGDNLICIGLIKALSERHPQKIFYLGCLPGIFHSMAWALQDLNNVFPIVIRNGREIRQLAHFLHIGYQTIGIQDVVLSRFDESFYEQHQIPFEIRWQYCKTPPGPNSESLFETLNPNCEPYRLVCNQGSHGHGGHLKIDNQTMMKQIDVRPITNNIFDWTKLVLNANEIHTIDTGFIHFVENTLTPNTNIKLFFHRIRSVSGEFSRRLPWQYVMY